ncbi:hypothetical protein [Burkholderia cenocepacia]|uniref:hypothetical protein n=1 Tax=Burkholderia cenocepacia TaxID=95486 RepID=UPI00222E3FBC|nr:hypothetical protein [Burkholderia cenocepacia]MCW3609970.1 hypothetical protein [Burkholderia cenocepacia]MCW5190808.1 hypothetical protein [Burkholderia cenocepacia]
MEATVGESRDTHLNSHRMARNPLLKDLVLSIVKDAEDHEMASGMRQRKRRPNDQRVFERQVECLICEALLQDVRGRDGWVTVTRSRRILGYRNRYQSEVMAKTLPDVMDLLACRKIGLLEVSLGMVNPFGRANPQTTFRSSRRLVERASGLNLSYADFGRDDTEEVIILKASKTAGVSSWIQYIDDDATCGLRHQVQTINGWLSSADIGLAGDVLGVSAHDRKMTRSFNNGTFAHGGRLSGGFWQKMTKRQRKGVYIAGEPTVTLDYKQMGPSIHYGLEGIPFVGDAYAIPGYELHRTGIKKVFGAMTHAGGRFNQLDDLEAAALPAGATLSKVCRDIETYHAPIAHRFYCRSGMEAMRMESDIIVDVMLELKERGVVGLPIHDAVLVRKDEADLVENVMRSVFTQHTGNRVAISREE